MESSQVARPYVPDRCVKAAAALQMLNTRTTGPFDIDGQFGYGTNRYLLQGHPHASSPTTNTMIRSDSARQPILLEPLFPSPTPGNPLLYGNNYYAQNVFQGQRFPTGVPVYPPFFETRINGYSPTDVSDGDPMVQVVNGHLNLESWLNSTQVNELDFEPATATTRSSCQGLPTVPADASPPPSLIRDPTLTPSAAEIQSPYNSALAAPWNLPYLPNNQDTWLWEQGIDPSTIVGDAPASFSQASSSKGPEIGFGGFGYQGMLDANPEIVARSYGCPELRSTENSLCPQGADETARDSGPSTARLTVGIRNREDVSWLPGQTIGEPQPIAFNQAFRGTAEEPLLESSQPEVFAEPRAHLVHSVQEVERPARPDSPRCPALERPIVPKVRKRERYKQENEVIVWLRDVKGLTFKQIADEFYLIFGERKQEPTLRGRYRNATKPPHERVRNPKVKWGELAVSI